MKRIKSMIRTVYFDPNSDGAAGYSNISSLLLFYDAIVLYGPAGSFLERCYHNPELKNKSLTVDEFVNYILKGRIIPLGFDSFWDEAKRKDQPNPNLRITSDFDKDLMREGSALAKKVYRIQDTFKQEQSPLLVAEVLSQNEILYDRILAQADGSATLPRRYVDYLEKRTSLPEHLRQHVPTQDDYAALPYLVMYDFFNNKYVMKEQGGASLHVEDNLAKRVYSSIHGFEDQVVDIGDELTELRRSEVSDLIREAISLCTSSITYGRLTSEDIDYFYERLRDGFIRAIWDSLSKIGDLKDRDKRKEKFLSSLGSKLRRVKFHASVRMGALVDAVLSRIGAPEISEFFMSVFYGEDDSVRRRLHHFLHRPLSKRDRWAYHFIKKER